jgi:2-dehydro-3-deoxygalactonokinase
VVFISCDWGSSAFRLRAVDGATCRVLAERCSGAGSSTILPPGATAGVRADTFARRLEDEVAALDPTGTWAACPVIASGMVTSAHGWLELPYARTPLALDGSALTTAAVRLPGGREVLLVSGLSDGEDVMRGEECELLGLASWEGWRHAVPGGQATVILPGTHCKHVRLEGGQVCGSRTYMTGELYALLRRYSVLRHSLPAAEAAAPPVDLVALREGAALARELGLAAALFRVRTAALLRGLSPAAADALLNGILIGAEFANVARDSRRALVLSAGERASALYAAVLTALGLGGRLTVVPPAVAATCSARGHRAVLAAHAGPPDATAPETGR